MTVNVAIIQARPVYYNLDASLQKSLQLTSEAARNGAQLVAFGETWLPGYPAWLDVCPGAALWDNAGAKAIFAGLYDNSLTVPGPQTEALAQQARESGIVLVMGVNERCGNTLYNSLITFDADGALRNHHRKLRPTYTERLVWGPGDGAGLRAPQTAAGKVGALVCWEHWMPLQLATLPELAPDDLLLRGGSAIYAPDGAALAGPCFAEETILHAQLDFSQIARETMTLDVSGHYARPDVFTLSVNRSRPGGGDE